MVNLLNKYFMKKHKIIVIAVIVAVIALIIVSIKFLPMWSSLISAAVAICSFVGGWCAKKWYDNHVKSK